MCTRHMEVDLHFFVLNASVSLDYNGWKLVFSNHKFVGGHFFPNTRRLLLSPNEVLTTQQSARYVAFYLKKNKGSP